MLVYSAGGASQCRASGRQYYSCFGEITITESGRELLARVLPGHTEVPHQQLFRPLSRTDAQTLADLLSPVRDHMRSGPPRSAARRRRQ